MKPDKKNNENEVRLSASLPAEEQEAQPVKDAKPEPKAKPEPRREQLTLSQIIEEHATEDDMPLTKNSTLSKIVGGDILSADIIRRQIWLMLLITFFFTLFITNRYSCQRSLTEIDRLTRELQAAKYRSLSSNSKLIEMTRESRVLEQLRNNKDSVLHIATQPPYLVEVPQNAQSNE